MGVRLRRLFGAMALTAASLLVANVAVAQDATPESNAEELAEQPGVWEAFSDAYFSNSGTFFRNRGIPGNVTWFLGPFPENNIAGDGRALHRVYEEMMTVQTLSDPMVRTADLSSPFDTSLLLLPTTQPANTSDVVEFPQLPAPIALPETPPGPVRALY